MKPGHKICAVAELTSRQVNRILANTCVGLGANRLPLLLRMGWGDTLVRWLAGDYCRRTLYASRASRLIVLETFNRAAETIVVVL
jgi:hypothetical protein